ncbi:hypothetical protein BC937DRAFT_88138 [Endogone sp. FLAS-F59071]|nr:hypothetical protein BC937DRAFT_88138 [Endogone sp. FLAS-F59071]|eukprot:RUS18948.1 hypothetical protein BC937DRAFT_88138 [Endogone sp. FLAS-F59071]
MKALECQICLQIISDPRTLPCGHNFCADCIVNLISQRSFQIPSLRISLKCPNNCSQQVSISAAEVKDLPKNFMCANIAESVNHVERCKTHDDFVGFIDITSGKLLCTECVKEESNWSEIVESVKARSTLADLSLPGASCNLASTNVTSSHANPEINEPLPSKIFTISLAEDVLKSSLKDLTAQSNTVVAMLAKRETDLRRVVHNAWENKERAHNQADEIFNRISETLHECQTRAHEHIESMLPDLQPFYEDAKSLSSASADLCAATAEATALLESYECQTAQDKLLAFVTSAARLQTSLTRKLGTINHDTIPFRPSLHPLTVNCPALPDLLNSLGTVDFFQLAPLDEIPIELTQLPIGVIDKVLWVGWPETVQDLKKRITQRLKEVGVDVDESEVTLNDCQGRRLHAKKIKDPLAVYFHIQLVESDGRFEWDKKLTIKMKRKSTPFRSLPMLMGSIIVGLN